MYGVCIIVLCVCVALRSVLRSGSPVNAKGNKKGGAAFLGPEGGRETWQPGQSLYYSTCTAVPGDGGYLLIYVPL